MSDTITRKTLTVTEAATCLGVSRHFAYQAVREGSIPSIRIGRRILIPTHAFEQLLANAGSAVISTN
jgi:excisionase family DNA binding protein